MKVNSINSSNFKGIWFKESSTELTKTAYGTRMSEESYVYRPFINEDLGSAESEVNKYDGKLIGSYYLFNHEMDEIIKVNAKLGAILNMREEEYAKIKTPLDVKYVSEEKRVILEDQD